MSNQENDENGVRRPLLQGDADGEPEYGATTDSEPGPQQNGFARNLGTIEAFGMVVSIVIGSGIFTSPGAVDTNVPSPGAAIIIWLVGGILAWTGASTMAELGTAIPGQGGVQPYLKYIFGDIFGFLAAWTWIIAIMPATLAILSIVFIESIYSAAGVTDQADKIEHKLFSILVLVIINIANSVSTKVSTRLNSFFVATKFVTIAGIIIAGISIIVLHLAGHDGDIESRDWYTKPWFGFRDSLTPDGQLIEWNQLHGWEILGYASTALYGALWAYSGWDKAIYISAELSAPSRQLPLAINSAVPIITLCFICTNAAYYILLPWNIVSTTDSVAVTATTHLLGPGFGIAAAVLINLAVAGSLLGNSFVAGRMVVAAASVDWLPRFLGFLGHLGFSQPDTSPSSNNDDTSNTDADPDATKQSSKSDAPLNAIILSTILPTLYILLGNFRALLTFNGLGEYTFFFLTVLGAIILRFREPDLHRPYKPFVLVPGVFAVVSGFVVVRGAAFAPLQAVVLVAVWGVGVGFYFGRKTLARRRNIALS